MSGERASAARPRGRISGARAVLLLAGALVFAAAAFDSPSLYVPGIALAILDLGLAVWVRLAARGSGVDPGRMPLAVQEREPYPFPVVVRRGPLPWPAARLEHPLLPRPLALGSRSRGEMTVELRFPRRGRWAVKAPQLVVCDPFGLHRRAVGGGEARPVLVLPRIEPVLAPDGAGAGGGELPEMIARGLAAGGLDRSGTDFEIDGLRPYRRGTPASRIHWPTVARRGELAERRLTSGGDSPPLVVLDLDGAASEEDADRAVRAAASLCHHLASLRGCALRMPGGRREMRIGARLAGWDEVHARLALVESGAAVPAASARIRGEDVFWVCANSGATLRADARGFAITPAPLPGLPTLFTVAGCHGQRLVRPRTAARIGGGKAAA